MKRIITVTFFRKLLLLLVTLFGVISSYSQNLNYQNELERMVKVPNSPEASAFTKYGNTSVSMYSGTPNVSIPIYTIQGRELSLPIGLTYDASGVKVDQSASQVGLSWNLNVGGRVSRTVNGLVDDYTYIAPLAVGYTSMYGNNLVSVGGTPTYNTLRGLVADYLGNTTTFVSKPAVEKYFKFLKDVSDNKLDTQPDYFSFNALGYSDTFVYEIDNVTTTAPKTFRSLNNPRNKIEANFSGNHVLSWEITVEDGTKFYFNQAEKTRRENYNDEGSTTIVIQDYYSSWLLTKIESANLKDIYEFSYLDLGMSSNQPPVHISSITNEMNNNNPNGNGTISKQSTDYQIAQVVLTEIKHNSKLVVDFTHKNRYDHSLATALDKIDIYKFNGINILKSFDFDQSYFGITSNQTPQSQDPYDVRLKLDKLSITSSSQAILKSYTFDYFSPENLPARDSYSKDYLGLFNGKNNSVLYPAVTVSGINFTGADRSPDFSKAITGTLKRITYPTGGYTDFTFEPNTSPYNNSDISSSVQDVTHGSLTLVGGPGNPADCGNCCIDQHGNPPNIGTNLFNITEAGQYNISYTSTNMEGEAYLTQRATTLNYPTPLNYNQIIDQSNCNELTPINWSNFSGSNGDWVYLTPGTYQITLIKGSFVGGSGYSSLRVHRDEATSNGTVGTGSLPRAGIRVKTVKDYSAPNILSTEKEYKYLNKINSSTSSGEILFQIPFVTSSNYEVYIQNPNYALNQVQGINTLTNITRVNSWSGGNRPHIAYATVLELQKGVNDNGYIKHDFNTGAYSGIFSTGVSPNVNLYSNDFKTGKEYQTDIRDKNNTLLSSNNKTYTNQSYFGNSTLYPYNNNSKKYKFIEVYQDANNDFRYKFRTGIFTQYFGSTSSNPSPPTPTPNCNTCTFLPIIDYSTLEKRQTYAQGRSGGVLTSESTIYNSIGNTTTTTTNVYDPAVDYLLRESTTVDSRGDAIKSKQYYPKDFSTTPYTGLVSANRLTEVIQSKSYKNNVLLFNRKNSYTQTGTIIMPARIETAQGTNTLEDRIIFHSYYSNGNLKEVSKKDGTHSVYIWGYNDTKPIAKIDNVTFNSISTSLYNNVISKSNTDHLQQTTTSENNLRSALTALRNSLPNAQVISYTYDPLIGVTSITDPRGKTIYYYYDDFNRLKEVKDFEGKILSNNQYNYKN